MLDSTRQPSRVRPVLAALLAGAVLALASCGDDDGDEESAAVSRACSPEAPSSDGWTGTAEADLSTGKVDVAEFNEYLAEAEPPISTSPCDAARVFLHLDRPPPEGGSVDIAVEPEDSPDATVTVTEEGLADDSIAARRWTLEFEPAAEDRIQLARGTMAFRCQPGRGHQGFSTTLCL
jgi:hypothetical protein